MKYEEFRTWSSGGGQLKTPAFSLLLISAVFFIFLTGCDSPGNSSPEKKTQFGKKLGAVKWLPYEDSVNGFYFEYPETWQLLPNPLSKNLIKVELIESQKTGLQVRVCDITSGNEDDFRDGLILSFIEDMSSHWGGKIKILSKGLEKIDGEDLYTVALEFKRADGKHLFLKQYYWAGGDGKRMLYFQAGTDFSLRQDKTPWLDAIAATFQVSIK